MRSDAKRATATVVALVAACSSPEMTESGFISLGRDGNNDGGSAGYGGAPETGGAFTGGGTAGTAGSFPVGGTAGTTIPVGGTTSGTTSGTGGTSTTGGVSGDATGGVSGDATGGASTNGGTAGDAMGGASTNGGTSGEATGGTMGEGGDGPVCGSGGLPTDPGGLETCERVGRVGRICTPFGVRYCGETYSTVIEQCEPGTCETGCCHETSDPCSIFLSNSADCVGDCGGVGDCTESPITDLNIDVNSLYIVRVGGSNTAPMPCGVGIRRTFELFLSGPPARITVLPPWMIVQSLTCADAPDATCGVSPAGDRSIFVMTDADPPPARNIVIESNSEGVTCPEY